MRRKFGTKENKLKLMITISGNCRYKHQVEVNQIDLSIKIHCIEDIKEIIILRFTLNIFHFCMSALFIQKGPFTKFLSDNIYLNSNLILAGDRNSEL